MPATSHRPRGRILPIAVLPFLAILLLGGCYKEGGIGISLDLSTYKSTSTQPKTLTLVDSRTGDTLWSVDIPVGQQCVVRFYEGRNRKDPMYSALMRWEVMKDGTVFGLLSNSMPVPDQYSRRLDMSIRPAPELPAVAAAAPVEPGQPDKRTGATIPQIILPDGQTAPAQPPGEPAAQPPAEPPTEQPAEPKPEPKPKPAEDLPDGGG